MCDKDKPQGVEAINGSPYVHSIQNMVYDLNRDNELWPNGEIHQTGQLIKICEKWCFNPN